MSHYLEASDLSLTRPINLNQIPRRTLILMKISNSNCPPTMRLPTSKKLKIGCRAGLNSFDQFVCLPNLSRNTSIIFLFISYSACHVYWNTMYFILYNSTLDQNKSVRYPARRTKMAWCYLSSRYLFTFYFSRLYIINKY